MKKTVENRMHIAEEILPNYEKCSDALSGFVSGSVAYGFADKYSDLEIGVIWARSPTEPELQAICGGVGGLDWKFEGFVDGKNCVCDSYDVDCLKVEFGHWTIDSLHKIMDEVIKNYDVSMNMWMYDRHATLAMLQRAKVVFGNDLIETLRKRIKEYPDELAIRMIETNLALGNVSELRMLAERKEIPLLQQHLVNYVRRVYSLLYGLNRMYPPSFKWTRFFAKEMHLLPKDFTEKIDSVFQKEPCEAVVLYQEVVEDLFGLIEESFPEISLKDTRTRFYSEIFTWER